MRKTGRIICKLSECLLAISGTDNCCRYQCLFCDGHERSHLPMGLLGFSSPKRLHFALMGCHLSGPSPKLTVFTNGKISTDPAMQQSVEVAKARGCTIEQRVISRLERAINENVGVDVIFEDGERQRVGFLIDKPPTETVGREMIESLGVEIASDPMGNFVKRNEPFGETNVPGVFAVGDAAMSMKNVTVAMSTGIAAAGGLSMQLGNEEIERLKASIKEAKVEN